MYSELLLFSSRNPDYLVLLRLWNFLRYHPFPGRPTILRRVQQYARRSRKAFDLRFYAEILSCALCWRNNLIRILSDFHLRLSAYDPRTTNAYYDVPQKHVLAFISARNPVIISAATCQPPWTTRNDTYVVAELSSSRL